MGLATLLAAAAWSAPLVAGAPGADTPAEMAFTSSGSGLAAWNTRLDREPGYPTTCRRGKADAGHLARLTPAGGVVDLGRTSAYAAGPVAAGRGRFAVLLTRRNCRVHGTLPASVIPARLRLAILDGRGRVRSSRVLTQTSEGDEQLVADGSGNVAAAWIDGVAPRRGNATRRRLRVVARLANGRISGPVTVPIRETEFEHASPALVFARRGRLLLAHQESFGRRRRRVVVRAGTLRLRFDRPRVIGRADGYTRIRAATGPGGRAVVAWGSQSGHTEPAGPYVLRAAVRPAGARGFRDPVVVDPGDGLEPPPGPFEAAILGDGTAIVAYTADGPEDEDPARVATLTPTGRLLPFQPMSTRAWVQDLVVDAHGAAMLLLTGRDGLTATFRRPGEPAFGTPEPISEGGSAAGAFMPPAGTPVVAWASGRQQFSRRGP